ncbi:MAG: Cytochrome b6-f complex iron-sulfur subunit [Bryobacteraceae bacterium]|nr:Cytochrome b6-f complex iron-sulfur subunit [Bryobacteraceae bacterium]
MQDFFFIAFPYIALTLAVGVGIYRYFIHRFTYSSLSSQLVEKRQLFWGSVPWHYGITLILIAHLLPWIFPGASRAVLGNQTRLAVLEVTGIALGLYCVFGIVTLIARRLPNDSPARAVTSPMDWILLLVLAYQVLSGVGIAMFERWGAAWYLSTAVPWLRSLATLHPNADTVTGLPIFIQTHFISGFVLILLFPFTRLVHIFAIPFEYLWRPYQVVIWNRDPQMRQLPVLHEIETFPHTAPLAPCEVQRRQLLTRLGILVGGISAAIVGIPSLAFLLGLRKVPEVWRTLGAADSFPIGETVQVSFLDSTPLPWSGVTAKTAAWLRREGPQQFIAFSINCTHLGCPVRWLPNANLFMCPCHGGVFYKDGTVASGPPPKPLATYPVRLRDGNVEILTTGLPITTV